MSSSFATRCFTAYDGTHQARAHRLIRWIALPVLFFCLLGLIWSLPVPAAWAHRLSWFNWFFAAVPLLGLFYLCLSPTLAVGLLAFLALCNEGLLYLELHAHRPVGEICAGPLVVALVALLLGRRLEKPPLGLGQSALFIVVGPAWLLSRALRRVGLKY